MGGSGSPRRGAAMRDLGVLPTADVFISGGIITEVLPPGAAPSHPQSKGECEVIDARGRVLMPGFVDCHTHLCFAGSRMDEWQRLMSGETYQQIAATGGGIMSTVRATRHATEGELACDVIGRADRALTFGTTTIEVNSGYGLTLDHEAKMLRAINGAASYCASTLVPTALLGHMIDADFPGGREAFIDHVVSVVLPAAAGLAPGAAVDAYCERSAWTREECLRLFSAARSLGMRVRVHTDQFTSLGMICEAIAIGARSVDHLEAATETDLAALAASSTIGVLLPCCGFHLDSRYASARTIIDRGGCVAIATNFNPGSAPCLSMPMAIALGVRHCKLTPAEAISGATVNAANVLGLADRGFIAPGARADLILLQDSDERVLAYEFGANPVAMVMVSGRIIES